MRRTRDRQEGPSDIPALKPYWGKPAVRDFRGSHGNVGIIRSPVRAMALPGKRSADEASKQIYDDTKTRVSPVSWEQHGRNLLTVHAGSGVQAA